MTALRKLCVTLLMLCGVTTLWAQQSEGADIEFATSGEAEKTQTLNQNALFPAAENISAETVATGNEFAPEGEVEGHHGTGEDYNLYVKVVVLVHVDAKGNVTSAEISMNGTTTTDTTLYRLAIDAAMKAKFNASDTGDNYLIEYMFNHH